MIRAVHRRLATVVTCRSGAPGSTWTESQAVPPSDGVPRQLQDHVTRSDHVTGPDHVTGAVAVAEPARGIRRRFPTGR